MAIVNRLYLSSVRRGECKSRTAVQLLNKRAALKFQRGSFISTQLFGICNSEAR